MDTQDQLLAQQQGNIAQEQGVVQQQQQQDTAVQQGMQSREAAMQPVEQGLTDAISQPSPQRPPSTELPQPPEHKFDSKQFEGFSWALIALAMIGGAKSQGNWLNVSAMLNGALQGYLQGDKEKASSEYEKYQREFDRAKAQEQQANKEFEDILNDRNKTINEKIQLYKLTAAKYDRQDQLMAANQKSIDRMWEQLQAHKQALTNTEMRADQMQQSIELRRQIAQQGMPGAGGGVTGETSEEDLIDIAQKFGMTPQAFEKAAQMYNQTGQLPSTSRGQKNQPLITAIMDRAAQQSPDAMPAVNKAEFGAESKTYSQTMAREAAVDRITNSMQALQSRAMQLTQKLNSSLGGEWANKTMNELKSKYGNNPDLAELDQLTFAIGRDYVIAIAMPGSNAQMHTTHSEDAQKLFNRDMPPARMAGALKGINEDVQASKSALQQTKQSLDAQMRGGSSSGSGSKSQSKAPQETKLIGGKTYFKVNGQWMTQ